MRKLVLVVAAALPLYGDISPAAIRAHISFLASDLLEGRSPGTRGFEVAAAYVAAQIEAAGLEPAGDDGTWFQTVRGRTAKVDAGKCSMSVGGNAMVHERDVIFRPDFLRASSDVDAEVAYAGFGVRAPELNYDDYSGVDVRGKIVLLLSGAPPRFPSEQRAYYSDRDRKLAVAADHGAVGVISVNTPLDEGRNPFQRMVQQSALRPAMRPLIGDQIQDLTPAIQASVTLNPASAPSFFANAPLTFEQALANAEKSISRSFALGARAVIHIESTHGDIESRNVVGRLPGAAKPAEHVVLSAHLDHLGTASSGSDVIFNGALDNSSGIAALIEIARAAAAGPKPARSIVFVALTGEEGGGLGAATFVARPPRSPMVANVNMDMFTMLFPVADVVAIGARHSTLGPLAAAAAAKAGFVSSPDPQPEEVRFIRSDQYAFVKAGIPAVIFKPGFKSRDGAIDGEKVTRDWLRTVYHTVNDNPDQKLDYASGARWADANLNLVLAIANAPQAPQWKKDDFFGTTFGRPLQKSE